MNMYVNDKDHVSWLSCSLTASERHGGYEIWSPSSSDITVGPKAASRFILPLVKESTWASFLWLWYVLRRALHSYISHDQRWDTKRFMQVIGTLPWHACFLCVVVHAAAVVAHCYACGEPWHCYIGVSIHSRNACLAMYHQYTGDAVVTCWSTHWQHVGSLHVATPYQHAIEGYCYHVGSREEQSIEKVSVW